jgi:hypothetical protein
MPVCLQEDPQIQGAGKSATSTVSIAMKNRGHRRKEQRSRDYNPFENGGLVTQKETASSVKTLVAAIKQKLWFPW